MEPKEASISLDKQLEQSVPQSTSVADADADDEVEVWEWDDCFVVGVTVSLVALLVEAESEWP